MKQKKIWVLVADGSRARIYVKKHKELGRAMKTDFIGDNLKDRDLTSDKPGRNFESANSARHAYQPRMDWHQYQKNLFARSLCDVLEKSNTEFDELIVISPPKTLGELRNHLGKEILTKVSKEIPKDVTKFSDRDLENFLERSL